MTEIRVQMSSDLVKYVVHQPSILDLVAFVGGISVVCYLIGKLAIDNSCLRPRYISPLLDRLFQVQDVQKLDNIKRARYTDKAINAINDPYKKIQAQQQRRAGWKSSNR